MPATLPPAHPKYILRGHAAHIHAVRFVRQNTRLLTGDADGWVVFWKLETKRPLAVWHAHDGAILGIEPWGADKIVTHGRDNAIRVWQLPVTDGSTLSTILPAEDPATTRPKPWLLHTLPVNTLNFCALSMCRQYSESDDSVLVATPSTDDTKINVYQFPTERLLYVVPTVSATETGMAMAVKLVRHKASRSVLVLSGYEGGLTAVHQLPLEASSDVQIARLIYMSRPHSQPVLSLDDSPDGTIYFTSSADAVVAAHHIPELPPARDTAEDQTSHKSTNTPEANGLAQDATEPSLEPAQANDDAPLGSSELISPSTTSESSPLSFNKQPVVSSQTLAPAAGGLSSLLTSGSQGVNVRPRPLIPPPTTIQPAHRMVATKHAGQQSLRVRSDGRIFATGGWDSRVRIYSARTLKEVAALMWHKNGVYAVDFAEILDPDTLASEAEQAGSEAVARTASTLSKLQRQREEQMQVKHWIAAGSKDGKVSLWEVF